MKLKNLNSKLLFVLGFMLAQAFIFNSSAQTAKEGMVATIENYSTFSSDEYNHPNKLNHYAPCTECEEDLSARTLYNKKYIGTGKDKGLIYTQTGYSPINIQDQSGNWITYDQRLKPAGNGLYVAKDQFFPTKIDIINGFASITSQYGEVKFNNLPELIWKQDQMETSLGKATMQNYTAGDDGVYVTDAWPGIDMEIRVLGGAIKTNYIVKSKPQQTTGNFIIRDNWVLPTGAKIKQVGDELIISNATGIELVEVGACIGFSQDNNTNRIPDYFNYEVNGHQVDMLIPLSTFCNSSTNFPYIIDPLFTTSATLAQASILGSQYNATCNFTNSCDYTVNVPLTPSAIIENVTFSFVYLASGACWLQDGAMRVQAGNCVSPSQVGYYWFCNTLGGGTCSATNVSIFSDLQNCLPPPSCTPANLPVTLKLYRSCWGATGCNNACIGANAPFVVNVTSRTLEYVNPTTQITLSNTTICQGASITASTSVVSGTAPISYNWSLNASGTPSVGTGSSVTINFPNAGTHTIYSTVTDACGNVITASRNVTVNPSPVITASSNPATICSGQSPNITLTSSVPSTTISWTQTQVGVTGASNGTGTSINQVLTNSGATNGTATYVVSGVANGCNATPLNVIVNVSPIPTGSATPSPSTICSGATTAITLNSTLNGVTYNWTQTATGVTGASNGSGSTIAQTLTNSGTTAGTVTYTVTPTVGTCIGTPFTTQVTVNISDNPAFSYPSTMFCSTGTNPTPTITAPGISGTFSSPGVTFVSATTGQINLAATPAGTYTITFTTNGTCPSSATQTITITNGPNPSFSYTTPVCINGTNPTPILATGASNGTYTATPTGLSINPTSGVINLASSTPGTYTVTNTMAAAGGCAATSQTAPIVINAQSNAGFTYSSNTFCTAASNPTPTVTAAGTTGTFSGTGVTFVSTTTGQINLAATPPGTYTISFTTNGACPATSTQTVTITNPPNAAFSYTSPVCLNGTNPAPTLATGAVAGTFSATPTGVTINPTTGVVNLSTSTAGTYTITNTIAASTECPATSQTATLVIRSLPTATISGGGSYCLGSTPPSITINLVGTAPWSVALSNGTSTQTLSITSSPYTYNATTPGNYSIISVSDANCTGTATGTVTIIENALPTVSAGDDLIACATSPITLNGSGASTYTWSNGITNNTPFIQPTGSVTYTVTGIDINGCSNTDAVTVTTVESPNITLTNLTPVSCHGGNNGSITTVVTGGAPPLQYSWTGSQSNSANAMNLNAGIYTLTATDNSGCMNTMSFTITQPDSLIVQETIIDYDCGFSMGSINLTSSGGTPNYSYTWIPAVSTTNEAIDLLEGTYQVIITDANACTKSLLYTIENLNTPLFGLSATPSTIDVGNSTTIIMDTLPGLLIDSVSWSPTESLSCSNCYDPIAIPSETTWYYATIYLAEGCSYTDSILITVEKPCAQLFVPTIFSPNGDGLNDFQCVRGTCISTLEYIIFNRWGEIVFRTTHQDNCWDGTFRGDKVQTGTYFYKLNVVLEDGTEHLQSGNLTVTN